MDQRLYAITYLTERSNIAYEIYIRFDGIFGR